MRALLRVLFKDPANLAWRLEVNLQNTRSARHAKFSGKPFSNRLDYQEMELRLYRYGYPMVAGACLNLDGRGMSVHGHHLYPRIKF